MSRAPRIVVRDDASEQDRAAILRALIAHNEQAGGPSGFQQVCLVVEDPDTGETIGGLWGRIVYDWLFVELLAVPDTSRRSGLGTELLSRAEQIAKARGCAGVWLDTYQFQAPDFYRKHGYQEFGRIADHPRGSQRLFFLKTL
ncbi:GNAT family N-acetyltransferase [Rhodopseudomonas palustris]|uniref:GNAT family N-acetyltransferase n=1 Tax=Rhodopseudomonas palustris TaxID=1076 RepID=A0A323UP81_RHOPL|nr:GNAT family N-acetyltransferase [Rhodopseudomonas palustris]PZA09498.1 GNAT family N-acetyltransferase [Rhodopseudomonas palustris]